MINIGFSTGVLFPFSTIDSVPLLKDTSIKSIELSALRQHELQPLINSLDNLDLSQFSYISVHAPGKIKSRSAERSNVKLLKKVQAKNWPIIMHPDSIYDNKAWADFGNLLLIENLTSHARFGRSAEELETIFENLPKANLCFDIGHACQYDRAMHEARKIAVMFQSKIRQVHLSEVDNNGKHGKLTFTCLLDFRSIEYLLPNNTPVIFEVAVTPYEVSEVIETINNALLSIPQ